MRSATGPDSLARYSRSACGRQRQRSSLACGLWSPHGQGLAARTTMPRAGSVTSSSARATVISPFSNGSRIASTTSWRKSGNSSRNSTPEWVRLSSPGRTWPDPPPTMLTLLASWCGAEYGGRTSMPFPGSRVPAREWIAVSSSDSSSERSGRMLGRRSASVVFPAPFGPESRRWWPPAAATSMARRASPMPRTSSRSRSSCLVDPRHCSRLAALDSTTGGASGSGSPVLTATACASDRTP